MKKLNKIKEELNIITQKLTSLDSGEVFSPFKFMNPENWYTDKSIHIYNNNNNLIFKSEEENKCYVSFLHKQMSFSKPVKDDCLFIAPRTHLRVLIETSNDSGRDSNIYIIEYSKDDRQMTHVIKFNEEYSFKTSENTVMIRLVLRIKGKSEIVINNGSIDKITTIKNEALNKIESLDIEGLAKTCHVSADKNIAFYGSDYLKQALSKLVNIVDIKQNTRINKFDFIFIESVGLTESEELVNNITPYEQPVIFWYQEDSLNNQMALLGAADIILVSNNNLIPQLKKMYPEKIIKHQNFIVDYKITNPIGRYNNLNKIAFINIEEEVDGVDNYLLTNTELKMKDSSTILGNSLSEDTATLYKYYDLVFFGSEIDYLDWEIQKCISSHALPLDINKSDLGLGLNIDRTKLKLNELIRLFQNNALLRKKTIKEKRRNLIENNNLELLLDNCYALIGEDTKFHKLPLVSIVIPTIREEELEKIKNNIKNQTYNNIECIVVLNKNDLSLKHWKQSLEPYNVHVYQVDESVNLGEVLNYGYSKSTGEILVKMDDDDYYGENDIKDIVFDFLMTDADIIGKRTHYIYFEEMSLLTLKNEKLNQYEKSKFVAGGTLAFTREAYDEIGKFSDLPRGIDTDFLNKALSTNKVIMTSDEVGYSFLRRGNKETHTWSLNDFNLLKETFAKSFTLDYKSNMDY